MERQAIATPNLRMETKSPHPHPHEQSKHIPTLPYDILTLLIDALRHDAPTLRACTLTARSWVHRARVHLHRSLTLQHIDFAFPSDNAEYDFHTMCKEVPVVLRYADELVLKGVTASSGRGAPVSTVLHLLQHIRVLRITNADLSNISPSSLSSCYTQDLNPSWAAALPNVENLTLSKTSFRSARDVMRLALQFKGLRTLRVEDVIVTGTSSFNDDDHAPESDAEQGPLFGAPTIRNLHILNTTKSPTLALTLASALPTYHSHSNLKKLHVDTTSHASMLSALKTAEVESEVGIEELHLSLQEELYPHWHIHVQGRVSNMTATDVRALMKPVVRYKGLRVLRLSVQRSPIVRMVQSMEGLGCQGGVLCSAWEVYREGFVGLGLASSSSISASADTFTSEEERFECRKLCLSFDARDIQGPKAHIEKFEETLLRCSPLSPNSSSPSSHPQSKTKKVKTIKFLIKEFIDPVLPDEPARLRGLWRAFAGRLRVQGVEVGVEFYDRRDFDV